MRQAGSAALLSMIALLGAALISVKVMDSRSEQERRAEAHQELLVDKMQVRAALRVLADCRSLGQPSTCSPGTSLAIPKLTGGTLIAADGSSKFGKWNVKVECLAKNPDAYWVRVAAPNGQGSFHVDPLTRQPLDWTDLVSLEESCNWNGKGFVVKKSTSCYGGVEGSGTLPLEIDTLSACNGCRRYNFYCSDDQRDYPLCPSGFQTVYRYADRYGWGGMDLTKYTICARLE